MKYDPDRKWTYIELPTPEFGQPQKADPACQITISERQILREYFPWWASEMKRVGKTHLISPENCIEDFVVVNWAAPVETA